MADYSKGAAYIDGAIVPIAEAKISILDWGFLHSDATYDVVHVWENRFFRLDDHLNRFFTGMDKLRMAIPHSREEIRVILSQCVKASDLNNAYVEMITTRGQPAPGSRDPRTCTNQFFAFAIPFVWITKPDKGLSLIISSKQRIPAASVEPTIKNYHWLDLVMGQFEAFDRGGETAAVVDSHGNLTEGPGFNLFAINDGVLTTPAAGILEGITRKTVIEIATDLNYSVHEGAMSAAIARSADELFATSTAGGVMPITSVDGQQVGDGLMGSITREIQEAYWAWHRLPQFSTPVSE